MKRKIALVVITSILSISLVACGGNSEKADSNSSVAISVAEPTPTSTPTPTVEPEKTIADVPAEYFDNYEEAEFDKYNSYASENGLKDTPIWIEGTYEGTEVIEGDSYSLLYGIITTPEGNQWATDIDTIYFDDVSNSEIYKNLESFKDKHVVAFGVYEGFSDKLEKPIFKLCKIYDLNNDNLIITEYGETSGLSPESDKFVPKKEAPTLASEQEDVPTITVDQISEEYTDSYVFIENCVIDCCDKYSYTIWVPASNGYVKYFEESKQKLESDEITYPDCLDDIKNGDIVKILVKVYSDGTYGYYGYFAESMEITGSTELQSVYDSYKSNCQPLDYTAVLRNPKKEYKKTWAVSGTIHYVDKDSNSGQGFLLDTEDGYVYVNYDRASEDRFIEGDNITVYGFTDSALKETYAQVDKVPSIWSKYIEFN